MLKTISIVIITALITSILTVFIVEEYGHDNVRAVYQKIDEENKKLNEKLDSINAKTSVISKSWISEKINRNTTPEQCKLENIKINIADAAINGLKIFQDSQQNLMKNLPCIEVESRRILKGQAGLKDGLYAKLDGYNGEAAYYLKLTDSEKSLHIIDNKGSTKSLFFTDFGYDWKNPKKFKDKFNSQEYEDFSKEMNLKKAAYKTKYGCVVVLYYSPKGVDKYINEIRLKNDVCIKDDVIITDNDRIR